MGSGSSVLFPNLLRGAKQKWRRTCLRYLETWKCHNSDTTKVLSCASRAGKTRASCAPRKRGSISERHPVSLCDSFVQVCKGLLVKRLEKLHNNQQAIKTWRLWTRETQCTLLEGMTKARECRSLKLWKPQMQNLSCLQLLQSCFVKALHPQNKRRVTTLFEAPDYTAKGGPVLRLKDARNISMLRESCKHGPYASLL